MKIANNLMRIDLSRCLWGASLRDIVLRKGGMTLIEVVIAVMILGLVMAGAYPVITLGMGLSKTARNRHIAVNLAQNRLERARTFNYSELILLSETNTLVDVNGSPSSSGQFRRSTIVNTNLAPNLTEFTVVVEVKNSFSRQFQGETEVLRTLFTEYNVEEE